MKVILRVTIGDLMLRNSEVERLEIVQELGQHTTCKIDFIRDSALDVSLDQLLRDPVSVKVQGEGGPVIEIFQGAITDGVQSHLLNLGSKFSLEAVSPSERLEYEDTVYFPQSTLSTIAAKFGVKIVGNLKRNPPAFDHVQWGESEFAFLKRLADEHGAFIVTTGAEPEIRTEFEDKGWELLWGDTLLEVRARARPVNHGFSGASYEVKAKHTHGHAGIRQSPPTLGGASKLVTAVAELAREAIGGGDPGLEIPSGRAATHADFKALLRQESERSLGGAVLVEGQSVKPGLAAGELVELIQGLNFTLPTTGKLGLIKVTHTFEEQQYRNEFVATPWKNFTNLERPPAPVRQGPVTAEVVTSDQDPDKMGRIKIRYRWQGSDVTNWARLTTLYAGNGRGLMFIPEVGDEVLVIFEEGDAERPVVVGSLWNGKDLPPDNRAKNDTKWIVTRSGNTVRLLDGDDGQVIDLCTPTGKTLIQLSEPKSGPSVVTIYSDGDIALEAKGELRIKSKTFLQQVDSDSARKIGGDESTDVGKNATIKAGMDLGLSGLNAALKGGMNVESVAGAINNIVGGMVHIQPPGFMGKQITAKAVSVPAVQAPDVSPPAAADPQRTADAPTPRG